MTRPLSPGIAFGCISLLGAVSRNILTPAAAASLALSSVASQDVLDACLRLRWVEISSEGVLALTARGARAFAADSERQKLRFLVFDHVDAENPPWLQLASAGRREMLSQAPSGIRQVFVEAGLAYGDDEDVIAFWDNLAARARGLRSAVLTEIGRRGERLTIAHEFRRTGVRPKWVALESTFDGYDVLSQLSFDDRRRLTIEVKASEQPINRAFFHISRNEWDTAEECLHHEFHLWDLSATTPRIAILPVLELAKHIPSDGGEGTWKETAVPFGAFSSHFIGWDQETKQ